MRVYRVDSLPACRAPKKVLSRRRALRQAGVCRVIGLALATATSLGLAQVEDTINLANNIDIASKILASNVIVNVKNVSGAGVRLIRFSNPNNYTVTFRNVRFPGLSGTLQTPTVYTSGSDTWFMLWRAGTQVYGQALNDFQPITTIPPPVVDTTPPNAISLSVASTTNNSVTLSWTVPDPNVGPLVSYDLRYNPTPIWCGDTVRHGQTTGGGTLTVDATSETHGTGTTKTTAHTVTSSGSNRTLVAAVQSMQWGGAYNDGRNIQRRGNDTVCNSQPLDVPAVEPRAMVWVAWKYGAAHYYMWETAFYVAVPENPWATLQEAYGWGNGMLLYNGHDKDYTGDDRGVDGPIASIRMKQLRRGVQDYEALWYANQHGKTTTPIANNVVPAALDDYNGTTYTTQHQQPVYPYQGFKFETQRKALYNLIAP